MPVKAGLEDLPDSQLRHSEDLRMPEERQRIVRAREHLRGMHRAYVFSAFAVPRPGLGDLEGMCIEGVARGG